MDKDLAIVMPVLNNWHFTKKALKDLSNLPHKIILVDNGSSDNTKNLETSNNIEIIRFDSNRGFGGACNAGFRLGKELGYKNVMFLNNDIKVINYFDSWTTKIIDKAMEGSIVGPTIGCLDDNFNFICEASKKPSKGYWYLSGWCITALVDTWEKLIVNNDKGPFSSEFFVYFEDTDLGFRAQELNIACDVVSIPVRHFGKATSKNLGISNLYKDSKSIFLNKWKQRI